MAKITSENVRIDYIYNADDYLKRGKWDRDKLLADARRVAKRTNQRLVRLEKAGLTNAPAYRGAEKALTGVYSRSGVPEWASKGGKLRYQESAKQLSKLTNKQLAEMLYSLGRAQQAKTSTPAGAKEFANKGLQNLAGIADDFDNLSTDDVLSFFQDKAIKKSDKKEYYRVVLQEINDITKLLVDRNVAGSLNVAAEMAKAYYKQAKKTVVETTIGNYNFTDIKMELDRILERKKKKVDTSGYYEVN